MSEIAVTSTCAADGGSVDVVTASGTATYAGLADGSYQFTAEDADVAYVIDVQVACDSADPAVSAVVTGVAAPPMATDTVVADIVTADTVTTDTVTTDTVIEMPMLFSGSPMPSSLPSTGATGAGLAGLALVLVVLGAAMVRLVRRTA
ncbi:MAG: hypothetical protein ACO3C1_02395 [Ilumatobacteraceae bacterium]